MRWVRALYVIAGLPPGRLEELLQDEEALLLKSLLGWLRTAEKKLAQDEGAIAEAVQAGRIDLGHFPLHLIAVSREAFHIQRSRRFDDLMGATPHARHFRLFRGGSHVVRRGEMSELIHAWEAARAYLTEMVEGRRAPTRGIRKGPPTPPPPRIPPGDELASYVKGLQSLIASLLRLTNEALTNGLDLVFVTREAGEAGGEVEAYVADFLGAERAVTSRDKGFFESKLAAYRQNLQEQARDKAREERTSRGPAYSAVKAVWNDAEEAHREVLTDDLSQPFAAVIDFFGWPAKATSSHFDGKLLSFQGGAAGVLENDLRSMPARLGDFHEFVARREGPEVTHVQAATFSQATLEGAEKAMEVAARARGRGLDVIVALLEA